MAERAHQQTSISWVRGHIDIAEKELADQEAAEHLKGGDLLSREKRHGLVTMEGWKGRILETKRNLTVQEGYGKSRYKWPKGALSAYTQCRTNRGPINSWLQFIGKAEGSGCYSYGDDVVEDGDHLVFHCPEFQEARGKLGTVTEWKELDGEIPIAEEEEEFDGVLNLFQSIHQGLKREGPLARRRLRGRMFGVE